MAVELTITGNGHFAGISSDIQGYQSTEDATPIDPNDTTGGVGQFTFSVMDDPSGSTGSLMLLDDIANISDGSKGTTIGTITGVSGQDGTLSVTADSRLGMLLATRSADPRKDTLKNIFQYYLALGGITTGIVIENSYSYADNINAAADSTLYSFPGWTGVIWDNLKAWAMTFNAEISLVSNNVVLRPIRTRTAVNKRNASLSWSASKGDLARSVEINYYQNSYQVGVPVYPIGGWNPDVQVYQVDAGELLEFNVPINGTLNSVIQPPCYDYLGPYDQNGYSVIGADGLAIKSAQWLNNGGSVTVAVGADKASIDVTIVGADTTQGPYRIAAGSGPSDAYSTLRISGTGTLTNMQTLTMLTGVSDDQTAQLVGATVDSPFISTLAQAYSLGLRTAGSYAGLNQSISVQTAGINRSDNSGSVVYPTFNDFSSGVGGKTTVYTGKTFNDFNTVWSTGTFNDFTTLYYTLVQSDFTNQAFGNIAGARVKFRDAWYRINSATVSESSVSYDATQDTTFDDFNSNWALTRWEQQGNTTYPAKTTPYTIDDFNAIMSGRTFSEFAVTPLWRKYAGYAATQRGYAGSSVI